MESSNLHISAVFELVLTLKVELTSFFYSCTECGHCPCATLSIWHGHSLGITCSVRLCPNFIPVHILSPCRAVCGHCPRATLSIWHSHSLGITVCVWHCLNLIPVHIFGPGRLESRISSHTTVRPFLRLDILCTATQQHNTSPSKA